MSSAIPTEFNQLSQPVVQALNALIDRTAQDLYPVGPGDRALRQLTARSKQREYLRRLRAIAFLRAHIEYLVVAEGTAAVTAGATFAEAGAALGISRQRAHQKFERKTVRQREAPGSTSGHS